MEPIRKELKNIKFNYFFGKNQFGKFSTKEMFINV